MQNPVKFYAWNPEEFAGSRVCKLLKTAEHHAIYRQLLDEQWVEGSIPGDLELVADLMPFQCTSNACAYVLHAGGFEQQPDGSWVNSEWEEKRAEVIAMLKKKSNHGRKAALERWEKADRKRRQRKASMHLHSMGNAHALQSHSIGNADGMHPDATETETETELQVPGSSSSSEQQPSPEFDFESVNATLDYLARYSPLKGQALQNARKKSRKLLLEAPRDTHNVAVISDELAIACENLFHVTLPSA